MRIRSKISERTAAAWEIERIQKIKCLYCWAIAVDEPLVAQDWFVKTTIDETNPMPEELADVCAEHKTDLAASLLRIEDTA